jgi:hypothetical protein
MKTRTISTSHIAGQAISSYLLSDFGRQPSSMAQCATQMLARAPRAQKQRLQGMWVPSWIVVQL